MTPRLSTAAVPVLLAVVSALASAAQSDTLERATRLAHDQVIVDTHIDVPYRLQAAWEDVGDATEQGDFDYPRAVAGGLDVPFMSIYVPARYEDEGARELADELIDLVDRIAHDAPDRFRVVKSTAEAAVALADGRIALALGMENGAPIEGNLGNLMHFAERGVRYITLAHSRSNHIADSSYDNARPWGGLSPFGKRLVTAMNEAGVMIDVSHISDAAFYDVMATSAVPVLATHSSARAFTPGWERNMSDPMIRALAAQGGVIQINFGSSFLTREANHWYGRFSRARDAARLARLSAGTETEEAGDAFDDAYRQTNPYPFANVDDVLDHIDHVVQLVGVEHVGLGSDFDGVGFTLPTDLKDVAAYPKLIAGLIERGYDERAIASIVGGNALRVWRAAEAYVASR